MASLDVNAKILPTQLPDLSATYAALTEGGKGVVRQGDMFVSVKDHGAVGNGIADDRSAIQSALTAAGVGGTIYFPAGTYLLATATQTGDRILVALAGQSLQGAGRNVTTLKVGNSFGRYKTIIGGTVETTDMARFAINGIRFDQNNTNGNVFVTTETSTYPRNAIRTLAYTAGSALLVNDCIFDNHDGLNTLYVAAETIDISTNLFRGTGAPGVTTFHDHSSIYSTTTVDGGTQTINGNTFIGNSGSAGAVCAIETHGGTQAITGNTISKYLIGANLTGWASTIRVRSIGFTGNQISGCCFGVQIWSRYAGTITTGTPCKNVVITSNVIHIDRDAWLGITGLSATAWGITFEEASTAPLDTLTVSGNIIEFKTSTGTAPANDFRSQGIRLVMANAAATLKDVKITDNTIINPLSTGMMFSGIISRLMVRGNTVVNPAQSTEASVAAVYRSFGVIAGTIRDAQFDANTLVDDRATHYAVYMFLCLSSMTAANNMSSRNNTVRYTDGAAAPVTFYPSAAAGTAPYIADQCSVWPGVFQPALAGSTIRETSTGKLYMQTATPSGTTWKVAAQNGLTTATKAPAAGAAAALPATPAGYVIVTINGTDRQVPYY
ncbi:glycosyl hydrolase family 28-related protein [Pseudarthrobacter sp. AL07]|uniref:glycosyl hydrolase family 28-related protein n=1 Tax=unclassified Pseudarthrobacter TaxID=2647000 RepID=UPI00249AE435|nr:MULTISPECIES: glycosyl hydrolase family 28-related protein [unclassified Pseudarthrobacter]MDI3196005.1 glycosyl hydrolase family 28-related protein [Pseudarthrobacter sp. AL20]MDI3210054.1 glycosyl hydrolase family 28-related protein [Pseudarthrobacter sp. AL07]